MSARRIVVVGAGAAGCAVALALRERGARVLVLEREAPGSGATRASGGMLAPEYEAGAPGPGLRVGVRARAAWPAFAERVEALSGRPIGYRRGGMLVAAADEAEAARLREEEAGLRRAHLPAELLTPEEADRLQPGLGPARAWLWLPEEGRVDADALGLALGRAVSAAGAELRSGVEVSGLRIRDAAEAGGGRVEGVRLEGGEEVAAEAVVLAAGAWIAALEGLARPAPVRPVRGQMLRLRTDAPPPRRLLADPRGHYLVPRPDGSLLAGSTMEEAGFDASVTEAGLDAIHQAAVRLLPALAEARTEASWAGLRPITPDGWPLLGPDPVIEGLHWAAGYGRNGILLAPLAGAAVAARILDRAPVTEEGQAEALEAFDPGRFDRRTEAAAGR